VTVKVGFRAKWIQSSSTWVQLLTFGCVVAALLVIGARVPPARLPSTWWVTDYLKIAGLQIFLGAAWCSLGAFVLRFVPRFRAERGEHLLYAVTLGVIGFTLLMYACGALGLFSPTLAIVLPAALLTLGLPDLHKLLRPTERATQAVASSPLVRLAQAFGYIGLFLVVLQSATPHSIHHDAAWSHLTIAEDYAREGRLVPFFGFTPKNLPHLSSILYTWAFLVPGLPHPALHWICAQWIELQLLVWSFRRGCVAAGETKR
jgi:hypothetical protein